MLKCISFLCLCLASVPLAFSISNQMGYLYNCIHISADSTPNPSKCSNQIEFRRVLFASAHLSIATLAANWHSDTCYCTHSAPARALPVVCSQLEFVCSCARAVCVLCCAVCIKTNIEVSAHTIELECHSPLTAPCTVRFVERNLRTESKWMGFVETTTAVRGSSTYFLCIVRNE